MSENTEMAAPATEEAYVTVASTVAKKKSKLPIIIAIIAILVIGGGVASYFFLLQDDDEETAQEDKKTTKKADAKKSKSSKEKSHSDDEEESADEDEDEAEEPPAKSAKAGTDLTHLLSQLMPKDKDVKQIIELQPFVLNLADKDENRFLRLTVSLGVSGETEEKPDLLFITRTRNVMLAILMTKTSADVLTMEGKVALRKEMLKAIQKAVKEPHIEAIYITELIVQK